MDEPDRAEEGTTPAKGSRDHYVVGKGKPPEHGKIKKGEVRNPRGKRRGTRSFKTEAREMLAMPVPVTGANGKVRRISTRAALLLKLREKALKGDSRALDRMMEMAREHDLDDTNTSTRALQKEDEAILERARERQKAFLASEVPPSTPGPGEVT
jgi:hypothetical protein